MMFLPTVRIFSFLKSKNAVKRQKIWSIHLTCFSRSLTIVYKNVLLSHLYSYRTHINIFLSILDQNLNMAAKFPTAKGNGKYDDLMTCKICHSYFDDPRLLPCSHTYCFRCIREKASPISGDFVCPMKDGTTITRNQINSLKPNDAMCEIIQNELDDTDSIASEGDIDEQNTIFVSGLPLDISDKKLIDTLFNIFIHCGSIKVILMKFVFLLK